MIKIIYPQRASKLENYQKISQMPNFDLIVKQIWTQKRAAAEGRRPLLGAAGGRDHIFSSKLAQN